MGTTVHQELDMDRLIERKMFRERRMLTRSDIAAELGVTRQTLHLWTKNPQNLTWEKIVKLQNVLGCELSDLVDLSAITVAEVTK